MRMAGSPPPKDAVPCEACGGATVGPFRLQSQNAGVGLWPVGKRRFMSGGSPSGAHATVCLDCGTLKLTATDLERIREIVKWHPEWLE
jgi:hypothetical protein